MELVVIHSKGLGSRPRNFYGTEWEDHVFFVGYCKKCKTDWQWRDVDYMGELVETDPKPAVKRCGEWMCTV